MKKYPPITITIQKRANSFGMIMYKAITLIRDHAVVGWGKTSEEAVATLKQQLKAMVDIAHKIHLTPKRHAKNRNATKSKRGA